MRHPRSWLIATVLTVALAGQLKAQTWATSGTTTFSTGSNWVGGLAPTNDGNASLVFGTATGHGSVNVDTAYSIMGITFSSGETTPYVFSGSTLSVGTGGITTAAAATISFNNSLTLTGAATLSTSSGSGNNLNFSSINNGGFALSINSTTAAVTIANGITGAGALTVTGSTGAVVFVNSSGNTYSGGTTIGSGATLQFGDVAASSPISVPGNVTNNGTLNFKPNNLNYAYTGVISGSGGIQMQGANMLTLSGANTYGGSTIVGQGTLRLGAVNTLPSTTVVSMGGGGAAVLDVLNNQTVASFGGGSTGTVSIASGVTFTSSAVSASGSTFDGKITGIGALVIAGVASSRITLTGTTNDYTGGTLITGSQLRVSNTSGSATGTGAVLLSPASPIIGATLRGSGIVSGSLTLNPNSTVVPEGTLTVGATTFSTDTFYTWQLKDATAAAITPGTVSGLLSVNGTLTFASSPTNPLVIKLQTINSTSTGAAAAANFDTTQNYSFIIASSTGAVSGFAPAAFSIDTSGFLNPFTGTWTVTQTGNNLNLIYTGGIAIPEPATNALLAGVAVCGLAFWRRRRQSA